MSWMKWGTTNEPGTCLWCGRKLRWRGETKYEDTDKKPTQCTRTSYEAGVYDRETCGDRNIAMTSDGWKCGKGHYLNPVRRVVAHKKATEKPGDYGDGFFCGLRCAYKFAVVLARSGQRLKVAPKKEECG